MLQKVKAKSQNKKVGLKLRFLWPTSHGGYLRMHFVQLQRQLCLSLVMPD
jgi:hypothetical protein